MADLSDFFDENYKEGFINRTLERSVVVKCFVENTTPPKSKRFVIVGIAENDSENSILGAVFINTLPNQNVIKTPHLKMLQLPISAKSNNFLDHDSFLDCSQIHEYEYPFIKEQLLNEPKLILGKLNQQDFIKMLDLLQNAQTIAPKLLKKYGLI
jgi:hypothetical protein